LFPVWSFLKFCHDFRDEFRFAMAAHHPRKLDARNSRSLGFEDGSNAGARGLQVGNCLRSAWQLGRVLRCCRSARCSRLARVAASCEGVAPLGGSVPASAHRKARSRPLLSGHVALGSWSDSIRMPQGNDSRTWALLVSTRRLV
jgi:hypothetical protein